MCRRLPLPLLELVDMRAWVFFERDRGVVDAVDAPAEIVAMVNEAEVVSEEVQDGTDRDRAMVCVGRAR